MLSVEDRDKYTFSLIYPSSKSDIQRNVLVNYKLIISTLCMLGNFS